MQKKDFILCFVVLLLLVPFLSYLPLLESYKTFNQQHGILTAFIKFALLATFGESIGLRIKTGNYYEKGFGLLPRALVWGFIGVTIKMAFVIFATGMPVFLEYAGIKNAVSAFNGKLSTEKVFVAFCTSLALNLIYAPVMMTFHKISDTHILATGGKLKGFFSPVSFHKIFINLDWSVQWNFVFKKTIPFFWIPAHTITFLLPPDQQVLFAALLGIALGSILAFANKTKTK